VIFEPDVELLPRDRLRVLQTERLRALVAYVKHRVPLYRERLADVEPAGIADIDEVSELPFTRKDDLRDTYPFGMFAVPPEEVIRIHTSSGTTGKLTVVGYTQADVDLFARVNARSLAMAGADELHHVRHLRRRAERHLRERIGCSMAVALEAPGTVPRSEGGKLQRVLDRRALG
jgi:phenylacetate-coenzyme A ligase PaaK-like adenylate-forming protein